jgi:hypothetical protein
MGPKSSMTAEKRLFRKFIFCGGCAFLVPRCVFGQNRNKFASAIESGLARKHAANVPFSFGTGKSAPRPWI